MKDRVWQIGFMLALFVAVLLGTVIAQQESAPKVIKEQEFILVGKDGKPLALLGAENERPHLIFFGPNGEPVVSLKGKGKGADLMLFGPTDSGIILTTTTTFGPCVSVHKDESRISLTARGRTASVNVAISKLKAILQGDEAQGSLVLYPSTGAANSRTLTPSGGN